MTLKTWTLLLTNNMNTPTSDDNLLVAFVKAQVASHNKKDLATVFQSVTDATRITQNIEGMNITEGCITPLTLEERRSLFMLAAVGATAIASETILGK